MIDAAARKNALLLPGRHLRRDVVAVPYEELVWCASIADVTTQLRRAPAALVMLDNSGEHGPLGPVASLAHRQGALVAAVGAPITGVACDRVIETGPRFAGQLVWFLRFALGQPLRRAPRHARTPLRFVDEPAAGLTLVDLSEDGFLVRSRAQPPAELVVELATPALPPVRVHATRIRELARAAGNHSAAYRFGPEDAATRRRHVRAHVDWSMSGDWESSGSDPRRRAAFDSLRLCRSSAMQRVLRLSGAAAACDAPVLIMGETGTGKELMARAVHERSARARGPFVAISCAALPETLVESELFGYEVGAFTGASRSKPGRVEGAFGGTLFLDEIGELPPTAQAKLLRALQERVIERVGGCDQIPVDFRLVAATNKNLAEATENGSFRADLFYRINVLMLHMSPLRERTDDIETLASHLLAAAQQRTGKRGILLNEHALASLTRYPWPGNVRELENVIARAVALAPNDAVLGPEHFDLLVSGQLVRCPLPLEELDEILELCGRLILQHDVSTKQ